MSIVIVTQDFVTLPAALLATAKAHLRVDWTYDDALITSMIARAISWFERVTGVSVNPASYQWVPASSEFTAPVWCWDGTTVQQPMVPITPVAAGWTATVGVDNVTSSYSMTANTVHGVAIYSLVGSYAAGLTLAITSGYTGATLPPGILDAIMRYTAHLYENREILVPGTTEQSPGWLEEVVSTYWMPRC